MAKTSVFSRPNPSAGLPRNSFTRGFFKNLNWAAGMLLPVFCMEVPKGSHGRINRSIFMRTAQLNTAAFPQLDNHIDFFKVPKRLLMTRYEEVLTNTNDVNSSALTTNNLGYTLPTTMPYFKRADVLGALFDPDPDDPDSQISKKDILGYDLSMGAIRLLDLLGYDAKNCCKYAGGSTPAATDPFECDLNAFKLLAYQKIYYDHFRNTAYEKNEPMHYNADWFYTAANSANGIGRYTGNYLSHILEMRYVNVRRDYFMNIYPALNYVLSGDPNLVSVETGLGWSIPSSVQQVALPVGVVARSTGITGIPQGSVMPSGPAYFTSGGSTHYYQEPISVQNIRAAFALDKLLRASAYAPKHVRDQIEARFGVKAKKSYGHESEFLGSFQNDIVIGEVTSTANTASGTSGDALGAIGGKGVSGDSSGQTIEFDTNEDDCIIMGIMYTLVRSVYDSTRIDRFNTKFTKEDYFQPEFMDLGLQPLYQYELETIGGVNASSYSNQIRGYVPRYQEYKVSVDENHGLFNSNQQLEIFTNHSNKIQSLYVPNGDGVHAAFFKMDPSFLDSIFVDSFDGQPMAIETSPFDSQLTDQFFGKIQFKFDVRQNMSVHGQPRL